ncbi:MAG: Thiamine-phosphate pyrophosphorylase [Chthonomonadaceae bacterium]|nr:Thiamine-phosphate pyrophosphorylase [Chthonomonadaceae bacterium]
MNEDARQQPLQETEPPPPSAILPRPCLMLVTEPMEPTRLTAIIRVAVAGGVDIVQIRDKTAQAGDLLKIVAVLRRSLPKTLLVLNSIPSSAQGGFGSGIHLPERGGGLSRIRKTLSTEALVGRSIHWVSAAQRAESEGADYLVAGTIFPSASHPDIAPAGLDFLEQVCRAVALPVLAIGGVTPERVGDCLRAGAAGVAVLSPIMRAADPFRAALQYRLALDREWQAAAGEVS